MAYFPVFINFDNKKILLVGGGNIAYEKLQHLLEFTKNVTLISLEFNDNIQKIINDNNLSYFNRAYGENDICDFDIVIAAIDNIQLQEEIYYQTRGKNILYNCVDIKEYCDFIFPAYIKKGDLTIAISTSGASPAFAKQFKNWLNKTIPDSVNDFLLEMKEYRKTMPKGIDRMRFLEQKTKDYFTTWKK